MPIKMRNHRTFTTDTDQLHLQLLLDELEGRVSVLDEVDTDRRVALPALELRLAESRNTVAQNLAEIAEAHTGVQVGAQVLHGHVTGLQVRIDPGSEALEIDPRYCLPVRPPRDGGWREGRPLP
jgi:hypothetical protein